MKYKAIIHFVGGGELTLGYLELQGNNAFERMESLIDLLGLREANMASMHYDDVSYLISRANIAYIEIKEQ